METNENMNDNALCIKMIDFEGHPVTAVMWKGRWCWPAAQAGDAIGYQEGRFLVDKIRGDWKGEFLAEKDCVILRGQELAEFRAVLDSGESPESKLPQRGARSMLILTESGIDLALVLSRTEKGRRLRRLLVDYVLPQLRATGTASLLGAVPPTLSPEDVARMVRDALAGEREALRVELRTSLRTELAAATDADTGVIGSRRARSLVLDKLMALGRMQASTSDHRELMRHRGTLDQELRRALHFPRKWKLLPASLLGDAVAHLDDMTGRAMRASNARQRAAQLPLLARN